MTAGYWPRPWTCEDGGPRRWGSPHGEPGLGIRPGERLEVAAVRDAFATDVLVRREPGELYALRHDIPLGGAQSTPVEGWVERLDPETLAVTASTPRLPGGACWPGGIAAHANGDLHMVFGRWAHRLSPELDVLASHRLPVAAPAQLVRRPRRRRAGDEGLRRAGGARALDRLGRSTPRRCCRSPPPLRLPEPSIARLASDGESVIAVGTTVVFRLRLDRDAGPDRDRRALAADATARRPERSYGWDPVITDEHVFWMDNGRNHTDRTMLGSGDAASPVRLWWARLDDGDAVRSVEISGLPYGTESNPPAWDPERRDRRRLRRRQRGRARLAAGRRRARAALAPRRARPRRPPDPLPRHPRARRPGLARRPALRRPLVRPRPRDDGAARWRARPPPGARRCATGRDQLVVLDLDTGEEKARVDVPSPSQGVPLPRPGLRARRLLPVADHDRPRRGRLISAPAGAIATASAIAAAIAAGSSICG